MSVPVIRHITEKTLAGLSVEMSLAANRTGELWQRFMVRRAAIQHPVSPDLYSLQSYPSDYFSRFDPARPFMKRALIEVSAETTVPESFEHYILPAGLYAVFRHKGLQTDTSLFTYIFTEWLPGSTYTLDDRPHFERLGPTYKQGSAESEEDIYIPVKPLIHNQIS